MMGSKTGKKPQIPAAVKLALKIVPLEQANRRDYVECGVSNHTDEDQRAMVRSKETKTIRKKTRIERLIAAGTISKEHGAVCQWYADTHEAGYGTVGCTANYSGMPGGGFGSRDHAAKQAYQLDARADYIWARIGIPIALRALFERVVLDGLSLDDAGTDLYAEWGKRKREICLSRDFKLAADYLVIRLERIIGAVAA